MPSKKSAKKAAAKGGTKTPSLKERAQIIGAKPERPGSDLYTPPLDVLIKLGSLLVHAEEYFDGLKASGIAPQTLTPTAAFDFAAMRTIFSDEAVQQWRREAGALLPVRRDER